MKCIHNLHNAARTCGKMVSLAFAGKCLQTLTMTSAGRSSSEDGLPCAMPQSVLTFEVLAQAPGTGLHQRSMLSPRLQTLLSLRWCPRQLLAMCSMHDRFSVLHGAREES